MSEDHLDTRFIEFYLQEIRDRVVREPNESIDSWLARTWQMAVELTEQERPPLPRVIARKQRSDRLLAEQLKHGIEPEKEEDE